MGDDGVVKEARFGGLEDFRVESWVCQCLYMMCERCWVMTVESLLVKSTNGRNPRMVSTDARASRPFHERRNFLRKSSTTGGKCYDIVSYLNF